MKRLTMIALWLGFILSSANAQPPATNTPYGPTFGATGFGAAPNYPGGGPRLSLGISGGGPLGSITVDPNKDENASALGSRTYLNSLYKVVSFKVLLPTKDAKLWVNNVLTSKQGISRVFITPLLIKQQRYNYDMVAEWVDSKGHTNHAKANIYFRVGQNQVVDLCKEIP